MLRYSFQDRLFLQWSIYAGVLSFTLWLSWHLGYLITIFSTDPTKITYLISFLFLGGTLHCGIRAKYLSRQINSINNIESGETSCSAETSLPADFLNTISTKSKDQDLEAYNSADNALLSEVFAEQAHAQHEIGWFFTSLLIKLGLLGTVIGFVLMLGPLSTLESFDISDVQNILAKMTSGMAVALNTTLVGLLSSMLLSFQYLLLDHGADELVARTIHYMETKQIPELRLATE
ncbi:MAG: MotA/TolQ/ExbB proton channel family protein [Pirellulales bacterium]|nr:MotA/TolQ/ExbB proton channel family protein [Pirellulales bacterium]